MPGYADGKPSRRGFQLRLQTTSALGRGRGLLYKFISRFS